MELQNAPTPTEPVVTPDLPPVEPPAPPAEPPPLRGTAKLQALLQQEAEKRKPDIEATYKQELEQLRVQNALLKMEAEKTRIPADLKEKSFSEIVSALGLTPEEFMVKQLSEGGEGNPSREYDQKIQAIQEELQKTKVEAQKFMQKSMEAEAEKEINSALQAAADDYPVLLTRPQAWDEVLDKMAFVQRTTGTSISIQDAADILEEEYRAEYSEKIKHVKENPKLRSLYGFDTLSETKLQSTERPSNRAQNVTLSQGDTQTGTAIDSDELPLEPEARVLAIVERMKRKYGG